MAKPLYEGEAERIVVVAPGPTFGQGVKFILFGAAVGFGAAYYLLGGKKNAATKAKQFATKKASEKVSERVEKVSERVEDAFDAAERGVEAAGEAVEDRLQSLAARVRDLGSRAKTVVEAASVAVTPAIERAVAEGKKQAADVQARLKKEVDEAGDRPALAEQDGTLEDLPSQKEDKHIE